MTDGQEHLSDREQMQFPPRVHPRNLLTSTGHTFWQG